MSYDDVRSPMLEPDMGKLVSPVLRGGGAGNSTSLPGVRHLTCVQIALEELRYDNGVRVEQPALSGGTGSGGKPADQEHALPAVGGNVSNPEPMLT